LTGENNQIKDDLWDLIEHPSFFINSADEFYRMLLAALDLGWQVEEPIYMRPPWNEREGCIFHFIFKKDSLENPRMISTRIDPTIEQLVIEEGWQVDRLPPSTENICC
jgi:hypothetical protein